MNLPYPFHVTGLCEVEALSVMVVTPLEKGDLQDL